MVQRKRMQNSKSKSWVGISVLSFAPSVPTNISKWHSGLLGASSRHSVNCVTQMIFEVSFLRSPKVADIQIWVILNRLCWNQVHNGLSLLRDALFKSSSENVYLLNDSPVALKYVKVYSTRRMVSKDLGHCQFVIC